MSVTSITARLPRVEDRLILHKQIVENLPSAILVFDLQTLILVERNTAASELWTRIFEPPRFRDLLGHTAAEIFPNFEGTLAPLFYRAIESGEMSSIDKMPLGDLSSRETFAAVTIKPMRAAVETTHLMVSLIDITEKIAARERQQSLQRMESVGTLAGGLAHDVNNVLAVVVGHAHILRSSVPSSPDVEESLTSIEQAAESARRLTSKLLTFAKGGSPDRRPISVNEVVVDTLTLLAQALGSGVEVRTGLETDLPPVLAEAGGMQQILMNLLVNARDAMEGRGLLQVRTRRNGDWVSIEVDDSGPGVPEAIRLHIFDPFFTTKKERGTGLGLSVVYGLVKSYEGIVTVSASPSGGARFRVLLPVS